MVWQLGLLASNLGEEVSNQGVSLGEAEVGREPWQQVELELRQVGLELKQRPMLAELEALVQVPTIKV